MNIGFDERGKLRKLFRRRVERKEVKRGERRYLELGQTLL